MRNSFKYLPPIKQPISTPLPTTPTPPFYAPLYKIGVVFC
nr:MAG TPA: hypothetical protein [Caudoviricetes sp.]